jgi:hypothetical protein
MDARHLPANWQGTANALEAIAFAAKDTLLVVDEFTPMDSTTAQVLHRTAERLLRAQANHTGRQRMRADTSLRQAKPPRGLLVSTGEDVPKGQSLRARMLVIEVAQEDVDWSVLTQCQQDAASGLYTHALAGFVQWLAPQYDDVRRRFTQERADLRQQALSSGQHRRTPENVASLALGWRYFLRYAQATRVLSDAAADVLWEQAWAALGELAWAQGQCLVASEPARRFVELLQQALASGRAHLRDTSATGHPLVPMQAACGWSSDGRLLGACIGWLPCEGLSSRQRDDGDPTSIAWTQKDVVVGDVVYLLPDASYAVAQALARDIGEPLVVSPRTLHKRLREQGYLREVDPGRGTSTVRRTFGGVRHEVLALSRYPLVEKTDQSNQSAQAAATW